MKLATTLGLLATATSSLAMIVVNDPGNPQLDIPYVNEQAALDAFNEADQGLEERQATGPTLQQAATPAPTQYPSITTIGFQSTIAEAPYTTYVLQAYTQLFSEVPQQWPSAGVGQIGYGTSKDKRDATPIITPAPVGVAEIEEDVYPVVLQLETAYITQTLQVVTEVILVQTLTVLGNVTYNGSLAFTGGAATGISNRRSHNTASGSIARGNPYQSTVYGVPTGYGI